jgi:hypothetical protein
VFLQEASFSWVISTFYSKSKSTTLILPVPPYPRKCEAGVSPSCPHLCTYTMQVVICRTDRVLTGKGTKMGGRDWGGVSKYIPNFGTYIYAMRKEERCFIYIYIYIYIYICICICMYMAFTL